MTSFLLLHFLQQNHSVLLGHVYNNMLQRCKDSEILDWKKAQTDSGE